MRATSDEGAIDVEAARVTLVALAGMVPSYEPLEADRVRVAPDTAVLSSERAARLLASMPKPLVCYAESVAGVLEVKCDLLAELGDDEQSQFAQLRAEGPRGPFAALADQLGDDGEKLIAAFGRGEAALVSLESVNRWSRDYEISFAMARMDDANDSRVANDSAYDEVRRRGAKGIMQFTSAASHLATIDGGDFPFPLPASATAEDRRRVERTFIASAKHLLLEINDEDELAAVERDLVERGEIPADSLARYTGDGQHYMHRVIASQMRQFFDGREMPAECAAFMDACRER